MSRNFNPFGSTNLSATINTLTSTLRDLGHEMPAKLTADLAAADAAAQIPADLLPAPEQAARRWFDLHRAGKDPAKDRQVLDLLGRTREPVNAMAGHLEKIAEAAKADAVAAAADGIVETLQDVVSQAQHDIAEARAAIGGRITDASAAGLNPDGHWQHARAQEAFARVDLARRCWATLARQLGRANWRGGHAEELLIIADLDLDSLGEIAQRVRLARTRGGVSASREKFDARTVAEAGHALDLADFAGFRERLDRMTKEAERQRDAARERFRQEVRQGGVMALPS